MLVEDLKSASSLTEKRGPLKEIINARLSFKLEDGPVLFEQDELSEKEPSSTRYVAAQLAWYAGRRQDISYILAYHPAMWARAVGLDDINSNYGEYVFGEGQLDTAISRLKADTGSRQALILFNRPSVLLSQTQDHICTTSLQFLIRSNRLHSICTMRSNELWCGFRFDTAFFTFLQSYVLAELLPTYPELKLGYYHHNVGSLHCLGDMGQFSSVNSYALTFPALVPGEGPALIQDLARGKVGPSPTHWQFYRTIQALLHEPTPDTRP